MIIIMIMVVIIIIITIIIIIVIIIINTVGQQKKVFKVHGQHKIVDLRNQSTYIHFIHIFCQLIPKIGK